MGRDSDIDATGQGCYGWPLRGWQVIFRGKKVEPIVEQTTGKRKPANIFDSGCCRYQFNRLPCVPTL